MLLGSAALNSDYISFEVGTEQRMMEEAYSGVTTQYVAQIALTTPTLRCLP